MGYFYLSTIESYSVNGENTQVQGCGFSHWSGHIQGSTNEWISKWKDKSMFLSFPSSLFLQSINLKKNTGFLLNFVLMGLKIL